GNGALPAPLKLIEERTVGPSLGQDSIRKGVLSFVVGSALVVAFMLVYYRGGGVIADAALLLNILFLVGAFAAFGFTLSLPGIAGIVLTIGMAVDANVLILEHRFFELIPPHLGIDFVGLRFRMLIVSWTLILIGLVSIYLHGGLNYGIDFAGGTMVHVKFAAPTPTGDIRSALSRPELREVIVQDVGQG